MSNTKHQHFWLIAGTVVFVMKGEDIPASVPLNSVLRQDDLTLNVASVSRAQMGLQAVLAPKMAGAGEYDIVDDVINNLMYLGWMTMEEFEAGAIPKQEEPAKPHLSVVQTNAEADPKN